MLTAKARQTNFVQTKDGLKPAEQVAADEEEKAKLKLGNLSFDKLDIDLFCFARVNI